jgi:diaminohydroxyphosphoribosylaminopyrimidine deaminase/5-amino-6-(5-phosphoribosylamino)uracil reductase
MSYSEADHRFMRRALALAARGAGRTNPNPMVGCVVVSGSRVVGEGFHARAGLAHAEALALESAGERAHGATLYVTLEPCAHQGRTPPCAPLVAGSGVRRVVAAVRDPDPRVNGRGLALLRAAGISVACGLLAPEARALNERFLVAAARRRPFVLLKAALTLDGRIATASGQSRWITSPAQRREARRLRGLHDGVLVGIGTVLADDPLLLPSPRPERPFSRVVLDSRLRLPTASRLARSAVRWPVWVLTTPGASAARRTRLEERGVRVVTVTPAFGRVALLPALRALWRAGITSLMVEGGSEVLGAFLRARLLDKVVLFRAPLLLGGRNSTPAFGGADPQRVGAALRLRLAPSSSRHYEVWYPVPRRRGVE